MAKSNEVYPISNGDFREEVGVVCWPMQEKTLRMVASAFEALGRSCRILP